MILPILSEYKKSIEGKGATLPLKLVPSNKNGLLKFLPPPSNCSKKGWPWNIETNPNLFDKNVDWPKITIITPSYQQADYLEETIRSILLQNYPNLEYIIMDGGSKDDSVEIIKKYAPWISYWESEKDKGQGHAINKGFSIATGDYYAWINSDDYYEPEVFFRVISAFLRHKVMFVYGYGNTITNEKPRLIKVLPLLDYFIKIPTLIQPSIFWNSKIHQPIWEELHCALDFELWLRLLKGQSRKLIKIPLSNANVHDEAKTHDPKIKKKWEEDHQKIWSSEAHGTVYEWKKIIFLNRIRTKLYKWFNCFFNH